MPIPYVKALHIIFVVTWFAGLFYIVRLFIYHIEAEERPNAERKILQNQFKIMERRLWYIITWPSMVLTLIFGFWVATPYLKELGSFPWLSLKLAMVGGLVLYHLQCGVFFKQLQRDEIKISSLKMRIWNEVSTLFLFSIVFLVILKDTLNWIYGLIGLISVSLILMIAIRMYKRLREAKEVKDKS